MDTLDGNPPVKVGRPKPVAKLRPAKPVRTAASKPAMIKDGVSAQQFPMPKETLPNLALPEKTMNKTFSAADLELVADFTMESREHLASIEKGLLALEQSPDDKDAVHSVFRAFHSIKGLAGFLGLEEIQELTHEVETLLDLVRNGTCAITPALVDVALQSVDYLSRSLRVLDGVKADEPIGLPALDRALLKAVKSLQDGGQLPLSAASAFAVEERPAPLASSEYPAPPKAAEASRVKVDTNKLDALVEMVGELVVAQSLLRHDERLKNDANAAISHKVAQMARITSEVQQITMSMRMVPIGHLFQKTARLARDLSRKSGKAVDFITSGEETELDRNIVEELADPLVHMIRNSMDHGLETPEQRIQAGKPAAGKVGLRASHQAGVIVVEVFDDGRGLDAGKIRKRAIERGLLSEDANLSEEDLYNMIFVPGFSTASKVTDVSGRGVGMDVVKRHIERLRGRIEIRSVLGEGTTFSLKLPLTLAIIDGLIVGVGGGRYILPIVAVKEMFRPTTGSVSMMDGGKEIVRLRDKVLSVVRLSERFGITAYHQRLEDSLLVVTETDNTQFCLVVDELSGRQEVVIKNLGELFGNVSGVAGGAILGDGRVGLILDPATVFQAAAAEQVGQCV